MSDATNIEWTDTTWNPVRGCSKVSAGCTNCYAERTGARFAGPGGAYEGLVRIDGTGLRADRVMKGAPRWTGEVRLVPSKLDEPLRWRKPRRVFVNSMSDLFHEKLSDEDIARVFAVMALAPQHTFQVLTKRPDRMRRILDGSTTFYEAVIAATRAHRDRWPRLTGIGISNPGRFPLRNVWLGVSVEDQAAADERIPLLLQTPAAVRFLSCEPLLGAVDLQRWLPWRMQTSGWNSPLVHAHTLPAEGGSRGPDWVIVGGESGPGARRCYVDAVRSIVQQCKAASVPCFVKQLGAVVIDRNDVGFDALSHVWTETGEPVEPRAWPAPRDIESDINGHREEYQGADVRVHLADKKGGDPLEWPHDLRVREFPASGPAEEGR